MIGHTSMFYPVMLCTSIALQHLNFEARCRRCLPMLRDEEPAQPQCPDLGLQILLSLQLAMSMQDPDMTGPAIARNLNPSLAMAKSKLTDVTACIAMQEQGMRCAWAVSILQHLAASLGSHKQPASAQPAVLPLHSALAAWLVGQAPHCTHQVKSAC